MAEILPVIKLTYLLGESSCMYMSHLLVNHCSSFEVFQPLRFVHTLPSSHPRALCPPCGPLHPPETKIPKPSLVVLTFRPSGIG